MDAPRSSGTMASAIAYKGIHHAKSAKSRASWNRCLIKVQFESKSRYRYAKKTAVQENCSDECSRYKR